MDTNTNTDTNTQTNTQGKIEPWHATWITDDEFYYYKSDGSIIYIKKGTWMIFAGRPDKVIVDKIYPLYKNNSIDKEALGPCGISYLPWREKEVRFASPSCSMRGNDRFIVCYPAGRNTYGLHINWDDVTVCDKPDNVDDAQIDALIYPMPKLVSSDVEADEDD
jgi:hypothetical protein